MTKFGLQKCLERQTERQSLERLGLMPAPRPKELRPVVVMLDEASYQWLMDRTSQMTGYSKVLRDLIYEERFKKGF